MMILLPGLCAAMILVGMHAYLGIHVITRGVIFVDLAMAQSAALGTMIAYVFFQHNPEHPVSYLFSLGFTLVHAALFAAGRSKKSRVPEEAIIGLTYAILSAITVLLIDKAPHGAERIRDMLAGQVLWVSWSTVLQTGLLYGTIGLIHFFWRKRFFMVSQDPEGAKDQGFSVPLWDFLFYATFGIIITSSVAIGGVLLVFTLLVAPAMTGFLYAKTFRGRLLVGYGFGFVVTLLGFIVSYKMDLPTGAAVVALFGMLLFPLGLWRYVRQSEEGRGLRSLVVLGGLAGIIAMMAFAWSFQPSKALHPQHPHVHQTPHNHNAHTHRHERPTPAKASHRDVAAQRRQAPRKKPPLQHRSGQLQALLKTLEGKTDAPLLERQQAFHKLCKLTKGALRGCPFTGDLLQLDGWLKTQATAARQLLEQQHIGSCCKEPPRRPAPHTPHPQPTSQPTSRPTSRPSH